MSKNPYSNDDFGRFLYNLRRKFGISRVDMAQHLGFKTATSVMNLEAGKSNPRPEQLYLIAQLIPGNLSVPILFSMFEANSLNPPCLCLCHHDMMNSIVGIYEGSERRCRLCGHISSDCDIKNGLWYEVGSFANDDEIIIDDD